MKSGRSGRFWPTGHGLRERRPMAHARLKGQLGPERPPQPSVKTGLASPAAGARADYAPHAQGGHGGTTDISMGAPRCSGDGGSSVVECREHVGRILNGGYSMWWWCDDAVPELGSTIMFLGGENRTVVTDDGEGFL
jgi:hypothetical protein